MALHDYERIQLVLLGAGKMGSALLAGWLKSGLKPNAISVLEPRPSDWLSAIEGLRLNVQLPKRATVCVLAVKPQIMAQALPQVQALADHKTLFMSIAAGTSLSRLAAILGQGQKIIRAMPNTPAAIGQGISAIIGNAACDEGDLQTACNLLDVVGQSVILESEAQLDAVTALSGSGPAYVFYMIEAMAAAGIAQGLAADLAMQLAIKTVAGAGALAAQSAQNPQQLRIDVTSPNGTTQAGLAVLMQQDTGLAALMDKTISAASQRSQELAKDD